MEENIGTTKKYTCRPALFTTALFVSIILADLFRQEYFNIFGHSLFAAISILMVNVLCQNGLTFVAWGLLITPFVLLFIGWMIVLIERQSISPPAATPVSVPVKIPPPLKTPSTSIEDKTPECCPPPASPYKHYM